MLLGDLILHMYYRQEVRIFECNQSDRLKKTLIVQDVSHNLLDNDDLLSRNVIGFGVGLVDNVIDINVEQKNE